MGYNLKPVRCDNCKFFTQKEQYKHSYDGLCTKDGNYTAKHRVCDKLPTNEDRRESKINLYK